MLVPAGQMMVARRFNAGFRIDLRHVQEGRLKYALRLSFSRPYGTHLSAKWFPALKRRAIFIQSLWDTAAPVNVEKNNLL